MVRLLKRIPDNCFIVLFGDGSGALYDGGHFPTGDWVQDWEDLDGALNVLSDFPMSKDGRAHRPATLHPRGHMTLSRRNLLTLLAKLEDGKDAVLRSGGEVVIAEHDAVHYKDRDPGPLSRATERSIQELESLLALRTFLQSR
jgi:hypothetical protein